jgi:hypothetical protein
VYGANAASDSDAGFRTTQRRTRGDVSEVGQGTDVEDLDVEDVAGFGAFDVNRTREWVYPTEVDRHGSVGGLCLGLIADVERIAAEQLHLLARAHGDRRWQVAVPPSCIARLYPSRIRSPAGTATASGIPEPAMSTDLRPPAAVSPLKAAATSAPISAWTCRASLPEWAKHMMTPQPWVQVDTFTMTVVAPASPRWGHGSLTGVSNCWSAWWSVASRRER